MLSLDLNDVLEVCPKYAEKKLFWPTPAQFADKLYGDVGNIKLNAAFFTCVYI